ncbi:C-C motif chemokine 4-like isoform X2 [Gopherus flavomarginatus]|uniref:C-C motif chemokine 4-like isoform X2 n=1 Tax=Gopherus flavomarginatus TaxID=286002 RepID=UPI0021CC062D|nr:C-C motif chemokine 4-like isoform X2 [Gopherus flavomarginatus]
MAKAAGLVCTLLLLDLFCCQSLAQRGSAVPEKCCFRFQKTKLKRDNTISCYPTSPVCPQPAVIFKMKEGQEICAKPDRPWVKEYQKFLSSASKA